MTKTVQARNLGDTTDATRKITSGATTIKSSPGILESIIISDPGQKCIVAIKDGTTTKMLFTMQQNTEQSGTIPQVIDCGFDFTTSLIVEMYKLDPILFLNFNNNSATTVEDLSGNSQGIDGTMTNMEAADRDEDAEIGKFINFSGVDEYITFGDNFDWDASSEARSICFWINSATGSNGIVFAKINIPGTEGWQIYKNAGIMALAIWEATNNKIEVSPTAAIPSNTWTHFTVTLDGTGNASGVTMYVNGAVVADTDITDTLTATSANAAAFTLSDDQYPIIMKLDEFMIFDKELSASEIEFIYRNGYGYGATDGARLGDITLVYD